MGMDSFKVKFYVALSQFFFIYLSLHKYSQALVASHLFNVHEETEGSIHFLNITQIA